MRHHGILTPGLCQYPGYAWPPQHTLAMRHTGTSPVSKLPTIPADVPQARMPLLLNVHVVCGTAFSNVGIQAPRYLQPMANLEPPVFTLLPSSATSGAQPPPSSSSSMDAPPRAVAEFLAIVRRRIYDATSPTVVGKHLETLRYHSEQPSPFSCGHLGPYLSLAARSLIQEAETFALCTECLHDLVSEQINGTVYEDPNVSWYFAGDPAIAAMAQARYYISLLHLHYDLKNWNPNHGQTSLNQADLDLLNLLLWRDLMTFQVEWWLSDNAAVSLLDGAFRFVRHRANLLDLADDDPRETARLLGLLSHEEKMKLEGTFGRAYIDSDGSIQRLNPK